MSVCVAGAVLCLCACFYGLAGAGCHCVRLSMVSVVRPAALSLCCVAGFALCGAVGVCSAALGVCLWGVCAVVIGALLSIKTRVYSDFIM